MTRGHAKVAASVFAVLLGLLTMASVSLYVPLCLVGGRVVGDNDRNIAIVCAGPPLLLLVLTVAVTMLALSFSEIGLKNG